MTVVVKSRPLSFHPCTPCLPAGSYSSPPLDAAAVALADVLTVALYRVAATFSDGLTKVGRWFIIDHWFVL